MFVVACAATLEMYLCHADFAKMGCFLPISRMARGQQKIQSQAKAAEKAAKVKKQQGHSANDQKKAAQKALVHVCSVCKVGIVVIFL